MRGPVTIVCVVLAACDAASVPLPQDATLIGKCAFIGNAGAGITRGDVFLYALRDDGDLIVVTGVASTADSLLDDVVRQSATEILPARRRDPDRLEFGGLAVDRTGDADHFVAMSGAPGELFTSIGTTYGTDLAYPTCVVWE